MQVGPVLPLLTLVFTLAAVHGKDLGSGTVVLEDIVPCVLFSGCKSQLPKAAPSHSTIENPAYLTLYFPPAVRAVTGGRICFLREFP